AAIQSIHRVLKPGGRFVAEFGGKGNIQTIVQALEQSLQPVLSTIAPHPKTQNPWYFPSISDYTHLLENNGFEVRYAVLFDRPTPLSGESGMVNWLQMFAHSWMQALPPAQQQTLVRSIAEQLKPTLYRDGTWIADYRRIRIIAVKTL
ncbi:MAG TPA: SAM-dependent methyltransferase, partial [Allocoleopsis sp.]